MSKKLLVVLVCILFFGTSAVSGINLQLKNTSTPEIYDRGNTLYVGGSGPGNYTAIQDAIDNSSDDDTVFVYSGTYPENVEINKNISLIGENKDTTIIDGQGKGHVVNITNEFVFINGFTIQKSKYLYAGIELGSHYNTITNNNIINNTYGILCDHSYYNTIQFNNIDYNTFFGIKLKWGRHNNISYNNVTNNDDDGIRLDDVSKFNVISYNYITSNDAGICFWYSQNNTISGNIIYKNSQGINFYESKMNIIFENNITHCSGNAIHLVTNSNDNVIYHNNLILNGQNGYDKGSNNQYDNGETGNYWDDYKEQNPYAYKIPDKGIWSDPYKIGDNKDRYPLIFEWPKSSNYHQNILDSHNYVNNFLIKLLERYPLLERFLSLLIQ